MSKMRAPATRMPGYAITEPQRQALAEYLSQRPWREVNGLLTMLGQLSPVDQLQKPE